MKHRLMIIHSLLPKEALKRAHVRFAIEYFSSKINAEFYKYVFNQSAENARANFETNVNAGLIRVSITKGKSAIEIICLQMYISLTSFYSNNPRLDLISSVKTFL
jgi:hypothetical protein